MCRSYLTLTFISIVYLLGVCKWRRLTPSWPNKIELLWSQLLKGMLLFKWCFLAELCKTGFESIEGRKFVVLDICTQTVSMSCICGNVEGSLLTCRYLPSSPTNLSQFGQPCIVYSAMVTGILLCPVTPQINLSQSKACDCSAAVVVSEECRSAAAGLKVSF